MEKVLSACLAVALVLFVVGSSLAAGESAKAVQFDRTTVTEPFNNPSSPPQTFAPPLTPQQLQSLHTNPLAIGPGTYNVGVGQTYATLSAAVSDLMASGVTGGGDVIFQFTDAAYTDTAQIIGGYAGQSPTNRVIFRPAPGVVTHILFSGGSTVTNTVGIRLDNAAGVVWDGSNSGGTDKSLTLECDTNTTTGRTAILIRSGSNFLTFRNLIIKGFRRTSGVANSVVVISYITATAGNHDITVDHCTIMQGYNGIFQQGATGATRDYNLTFTRNLIGGGGSDTLSTLARSGIELVQFADNVLIDQNDINGVKTVGLTAFGIEVRGGHSNIMVTRNKFHNIDMLSGANLSPLNILIGNVVSAGPGIKTTAFFYNNMIYDSHNYGTLSTSARANRGITWNPTSGTANSPNGVGSTVVLVNNTFHLDMAAGEAGGAGLVYPIDGNYIGSSNNGFADSLIMRNNIFSATRGTDQAWAMLFIGPTTAGMLNVDADNNLYNIVTMGANGFGSVPNPWPTGATTTVATLADWQTVSGNDVNSLQADPLFVGRTDAHINTSPGFMSPADSLALPDPAVTVDIDGQPRDPNHPDAGADEFTVTPANKDIQVLSVSLSPATPHVGTPVTVSAVLKNNGNEVSPASIDVTYKVGSTPGIVSDGTTQNFSPVWSGNITTVTFATPSTPLVAGILDMHVRAFYAGDAVPVNDSAHVGVNVLSGGVWVNETFTESNFPPLGWNVTTTALFPAWSRAAAIQSDGAAGYGGRLGFYNQDSLALDSLYTPVLDLSALQRLTAAKYLSFDHAYQAYSSTTYPDSVRIAASSDGGATWSVLYNDGNPGMQTAGTGSAEYTPASPAEWRHHTVLVPAGILTNNFKMVIVGKSAFGNDFWIDNVRIKTLPDTDYTVTALYQVDGIPTPFRPVGFSSINKKTFTRALAVGRTVPRGTVSTSRVIPGSLCQTGGNRLSVQFGAGSPFETDANLPITLKTVVQNVGSVALPYQVDWTLGGISQTPVSRGALSTLAVDSVSLSTTPAQRGTLTTTASVTLAHDADPSDNTKTTLRTYVYPSPMFRIHYDNGSSVPTTNVGFGSLTAPIEMGVRFTASADMRLANVDASYRNEASIDSITVKVYDAGTTTSAPGPLRYSKKFAGVNYISSGGDYFTLPLGNDAPAYASGSDFWVSVLFPPGILFPGGAQDSASGITVGHSFYSGDSGATWSPLVLSNVSYAWLLRAIGGLTASSIGVPVSTNWNMVSLPVSSPVPDDSVKHLFTNSVNLYAFIYAGGYQQRFRMTNGPGYWIKSSTTYTQDVTGTPQDTLSIPVNNAWNMVGSISTAVDTSVAHVTPSVPGLRVSNFFKYAGGYQIVTTIQPGLGYWVKTSGPGSFFMHATGPAAKVSGGVSGGSIENLNSLTIRDANGGSQTLYFGADGKKEIPVNMFVMPPLPPVGSFDARFETAEGGTMAQTHPEEVSDVIDLPIAIQSSAYPLTVSWKINGTSGSYELSDGAGVLHPVRGEGSLKIANSAVNHITLKVTGSGSDLPKEFSLSQNYPNPFNPTTTIKYGLPVDSRVTVEIYNVLGQRVRTLLNEDSPAGRYVVEWNGTGNENQQLGSGTYFLRLSAKGVDGKAFNEIRKLLLLK